MSRGAFRGLVFLFLFTLILGAANLIFTARDVNAVRGSLAASQHAEASVKQLCLAANESRSQQIALWDHILSISQPPPHETPAEAARRAMAERQFKAYVGHVFAPRDCTRPLTLGG